jgi:hypothetical protein
MNDYIFFYLISSINLIYFSEILLLLLLLIIIIIMSYVSYVTQWRKLVLFFCLLFVCTCLFRLVFIST